MRVPGWLMCALGLVCAASPNPALGEPSGGRFSLAGGLDYSTGTYGQSTSTDIWYASLTGRYETPLYFVKATVSYLSITGNGTVVPGGVEFSSESSTRITSEGLGDTVVSAGYAVYPGSGSLPHLDLTANVKIGSADRHQQLGTGADDYSVQVDAYQRYGSLIPFGTIGYLVPGSAPGFTLHPAYYGTLGVILALSPTANVGAIWRGQEAISSPGFPQDEVMVYGELTHSQKYKTQVYVGRGLETGSPDWEAGVVVTRQY